jgi:hypothetical protein
MTRLGLLHAETDIPDTGEEVKDCAVRSLRWIIMEIDRGRKGRVQEG